MEDNKLIYDHLKKTGSWNAAVQVTSDSDTRYIDGVDESIQDEISASILKGYERGLTSSKDSWVFSGFFTLAGEDVPFYELSDSTKKEIVNAMKDGSYSGEINETNEKTYELSAESLELDSDYVTGVLIATDINDSHNKKTVGFEYNVEVGDLILHQYSKPGWMTGSSYEIETDPVFTDSGNIKTIADFIENESETFKDNELDKRAANRFECTRGQQGYVITDSKTGVVFSIGDPEEKITVGGPAYERKPYSLNSWTPERIEDYTNVIGYLANQSQCESIDYAMVSYGNCDKENFDFRMYNDADKRAMKNAIIKRLSADLLPAKKKSLSQVKKEIEEKKVSMNHAKEKTRERNIAL